MREILCGSCDGSGRDNLWQPCFTCKGCGYVTVSDEDDDPDDDDYADEGEDG